LNARDGLTVHRDTQPAIELNPRDVLTEVRNTRNSHQGECQEVPRWYLEIPGTVIKENVRDAKRGMRD
jgi:hypothetical protein